MCGGGGEERGGGNGGGLSAKRSMCAPKGDVMNDVTVDLESRWSELLTA